MTDSFNNITQTIVMKVKETQDDFIFKCIQPFCEEILSEFTIEKKDLVEALCRHKPIKVIIVPDNDNFPHHYVCPSCSRIIKHLEERYNFCPTCGQALNWKTCDHAFDLNEED